MQHLQNITTGMFGKHAVTTIVYKGQPCWVAQEVGDALGYSAGGARFVKKIAESWADEFIEGDDFFKLESDELDRLRAFLAFAGPESGPANVSSKTRSLILLTQQGVWLATMKSNKPAGKVLRRWLSREVLPSLARTGSFAIGEMRRMYPTHEAQRAASNYAKEMRIQADILYKAKAIPYHVFVEWVRRSSAIFAPDLADQVRPHPQMPLPQGIVPGTDGDDTTTISDLDV